MIKISRCEEFVGIADIKGVVFTLNIKQQLTGGESSQLCLPPPPCHPMVGLPTVHQQAATTPDHHNALYTSDIHVGNKVTALCWDTASHLYTGDDKGLVSITPALSLVSRNN